MEIALRAGRGNFSEAQRSSRSLARLQNGNTRSRFSSSCGCRPQTTSVTYGRVSAALTRRVTKVHSRNCYHSATEDAAAGIDMRISLCSSLLRRKIVVALGISYSLSKGFGVQASLRGTTIVDYSSEAFSIVYEYCRETDLLDRPGSWEEITNELQKLFQDRRASPHDRLAHGGTLMHVSHGCSNLSTELKKVNRCFVTGITNVRNVD